MTHVRRLVRPLASARCRNWLEDVGLRRQRVSAPRSQSVGRRDSAGGAQSGAVFTTLQEASRRTRDVLELDLRGSDELICRNVFCEKLGEPCVCRLASVLERTKNVRRLVLRGCGIGAVPDGVWHLPLLRSLDLSGNRLDSLRVPDNGGLALEELVLSDNPQLRVFDAGKGALPILRTLDLRGCDRCELGPGIAYVQHWAGGMELHR